MRTFVLASASPRRRDILQKSGYNFVIEPADIDEDVPFEIETELIAEYLAEKKARAVAEKTGNITLGADTVVILDGAVLGKPKDKAQNAEYLKALSGRTHVVITGYCIIDGKTVYSGSDSAFVTFRNLSGDEINAYVESGNGLDKAGGYGVQDEYSLVERVDGEYETVVGLPISKVNGILEKIL